MKVLIGTPVHNKKDRAIKKWLRNVVKLTYPADILLVDSSPDLSYVDKIKGYCKKYKVKNCRIEHLEINQELGVDERTNRSREIIRQEVLSKDYDAWFSWECDRPIPADTLSKLIKMMKKEKYSIIHQIFGVLRVPIEFKISFDCTLVNRECLEKYGFLLEYPGMPDCWHPVGSWFKKQVVDDGGSYVEVYGTIGPIRDKGARKMKVLVGAAIHQVKDYGMERWLKNVSKLEYPADLLMVDNTSNPDYFKKVRKYCNKYAIRNYKLVHLSLDPDLHPDRKVEMSQEIIRQEILTHDYDAWFSWECDQLIPTDALDRLVSMMNSGGFMMVNHNGWVRDNPGITCTDFNVSLVSRKCFEKYSFLLQLSFDHSEIPKKWECGEIWIKKQVLKGGGSILEAEGVIDPIYHLSK